MPNEMFALVDMEKMCVCYKHPVQKSLTDLMHIEFPHCTATVIDANDPAFQNFSDLELKLLYKNTCGQPYEMYGREGLIKNLTELFKLVPESALDVGRISSQSSLIEREDFKLYKYNPDGNVPKIQDNPLALKPLTASASFAPIHYPSTAPQTPPASEPQAQSTFPNHAQAIGRAERKPIVPSAPKIPKESGDSAAPKAGSKTGRVWEIAEQIWIDAGKPSETKALRGQIVSACEAEGINGSTASVQYSKWRASKS